MSSFDATMKRENERFSQGVRSEPLPAVTIKGSVIDMSPGDQGSTTNPTAPLDSPTKPGTVPCVNAASMETQMEYLYMQHPIDGFYHNETITGVPVILMAIASDGTVTDLGTITTNGYYGTYSFE